MATELRAAPDGGGRRFAVAASRFHEPITRSLADGARLRLEQAGAEVDVAWCPGAVELPQVARALAVTGRYDGVVAVGCVVRGDTPHFDHVCRIVADGLSRVALDTGLAVGFGVLTCDTLDQARARSAATGLGTAEQVKVGAATTSNKGVEAAEAALETASLLRAIGGRG